MVHQHCLLINIVSDLLVMTRTMDSLEQSSRKVATYLLPPSEGTGMGPHKLQRLFALLLGGWEEFLVVLGQDARLADCSTQLPTRTYQTCQKPSLHMLLFKSFIT